MHSCSLNCHLSPDSGTYTSGSNLQYGFRPVCPSVSWTPPHRHPKCSSCPLRPELRSTGPIFSVCLITQSCSTLCNPMYCSLPGCSVHGHSPGKNAGVGCHALLQGIFPTQGSNPALPHCRQIFLPSVPPGKPAFSCFCLSEQHQHLSSCINQKPRSHSWDFLPLDLLSLQNSTCHSTLRICTFLYLPSPLTTLVSATAVCSLTRAPKGAPCILSFYQPVPPQSGFHTAILIGMLPLRPYPQWLPVLFLSLALACAVLCGLTPKEPSSSTRLCLFRMFTTWPFFLFASTFL